MVRLKGIGAFMTAVLVVANFAAAEGNDSASEPASSVLDRVVSVSFQNGTLSSAIRSLNGSLKDHEAIIVFPKRLQERSKASDCQIAETFRNITIASLLEELLSRRDLTYRVIEEEGTAIIIVVQRPKPT